MDRESGPARPPVDVYTFEPGHNEREFFTMVTGGMSGIGKATVEALVEAIHEETEGNPFFVEEVFQHLSEEGKLFDEEGRWKSDLKIDELDVPEGVRLDNLLVTAPRPRNPRLPQRPSTIGSCAVRRRRNRCRATPCSCCSSRSRSDAC